MPSAFLPQQAKGDMRGWLLRSFNRRYIISGDMDRWMDQDGSSGGRRK